MHGEDRLNIKTQLIIGALKLAEFPDHISIDCDRIEWSWTKGYATICFCII